MIQPLKVGVVPLVVKVVSYSELVEQPLYKYDLSGDLKRINPPTKCKRVIVEYNHIKYYLLYDSKLSDFEINTKLKVSRKLSKIIIEVLDDVE